jgi:acetyltransferase-like isoleucine patch superfamily enzyme
VLKKIYLSPIGYLIALVLNIIGGIFRPFMIYGYWNTPTHSFRKLTRVSSTAVLIDKNNISIGENCWIGHHSIIDGSNGVKIGEGVQIAGLSGIYSHSSHIAIRLCGTSYIQFSEENRSGYIRASVEIGDFSFIGVSAIILPGVKIGKGCVIGAGSVVTHDVPDYSVAVGNPAKVIGSTLDMDREFFDDPRIQSSYFDAEVIRKFNSESNSINPKSEG